MGGVETGLDLEAAMARLPEGVPAHAVRRLLLIAEPKALAAIGEKRAEMEEGRHGKV